MVNPPKFINVLTLFQRRNEENAKNTMEADKIAEFVALGNIEEEEVKLTLWKKKLSVTYSYNKENH